MPKFAGVMIGLLVGFAAGVAAGLVLVTIFSANTHDKDVEMVMTAAFVTGPIGAVVGVLVALLRRRR